jgi:hypothetical protein
VYWPYGLLIFLSALQARPIDEIEQEQRDEGEEQDEQEGADIP